jgi:hypothetical protein
MSVRLWMVFGLLFCVCFFAGSGCGTSRPAEDVPDETAEDPFTDRVGSGTARVTGSVYSADAEAPIPLGGVLLVLGDAVSHSNVDGSFILLGVPEGAQSLWVDGGDAQAGDGFYGQFAGVMDVAAGEDLVLERPIYIPFVPFTSLTQISADETTVARSAEGVTLTIPAGGVRRRGLEYAGEISVQAIAPSRTPFPLPEEFAERAGLIVSIQPVDLEFPVPLRITFPLEVADTPAGGGEDGSDADGGSGPADGSQGADDSSEGGTGGGGSEANDGADGLNGAVNASSAEQSAFRSLWSFMADSGQYVNTGIASTQVFQVSTSVGGVRSGGSHFLTELMVTLVEPCAVGDPELNRACLQGWLRVLDEVVALNAVELPGSVTVLFDLNEALTERGTTVESAQAAVATSESAYELSAAAVAAYQTSYAQLDDLSVLAVELEIARESCPDVGGCGDASSAEVQAEAEARVDAARRLIGTNVGAYASRFDRLNAAVQALGRYYEEDSDSEFGSGVNADNLAAFQLAAAELNAAYEDFGELASPVAAYDALVAAANELESATRAVVSSVGTPATTSGAADAWTDAASPRLLRVCNGSGVTLVSAPGPDGFADLPLSDPAANGEEREECVLVGIDAGRGLCSQPIEEGAFLAALTPPMVIGLDRTLTTRSLTQGTPVAGTLAADTPWHVWRFDGREREGVQVDFATAGAARAGLATEDGLLRISSPGGFEVANLTGGESFAVHVYSTVPLVAEQEIDYQLSLTRTQDLFDFGSSVLGSFDVMTRAAAVLFDAEAGERVFLENRCCGDQPGAYEYRLLGPFGGALPEVAYDLAGVGQGSTLYEVLTTGTHRVALQPLPGSFSDYEIVVHRVEVAPALPYELGTEVAVNINQIGAAAAYEFAVTEATEATLQGRSAVGLDPMIFSVASATTGELVVPDTLLYFDGSSFATRSFFLPDADSYLLSWRVPLDAQQLTGSFTFQLNADLPSEGGETPTQEPEGGIDGQPDGGSGGEEGGSDL